MEENSRPTTAQLRAELNRVSQNRKKKRSPVGGILLILFLILLVAAITFLLLLPSYVVYGDSMMPSLEEGDLVFCWPWSEVQPGDMIAMKHEDRVLIKRVIGIGGDTIEIREDGRILRNGVLLNEPYAQIAEQGSTDTENPCTVPAGSYYVLGDNRASSVDSRNSIIGFVKYEEVIGRLFLRAWPLTRISLF